MKASTERHQRTIEILADILERSPSELADDHRLREDLGLDSLQSLELLSSLSEALRLDLPMEEAMELRTVADACAFVERAARASHAHVEPHA